MKIRLFLVSIILATSFSIIIGEGYLWSGSKLVEILDREVEINDVLIVTAIAALSIFCVLILGIIDKIFEFFSTKGIRNDKKTQMAEKK